MPVPSSERAMAPSILSPIRAEMTSIFRLDMVLNPETCAEEGVIRYHRTKYKERSVIPSKVLPCRNTL